MFKKKFEMTSRGVVRIRINCKKCGKNHYADEPCYTAVEDKNLEKSSSYKKNSRK